MYSLQFYEDKEYFSSDCSGSGFCSSCPGQEEKSRVNTVQPSLSFVGLTTEPATRLNEIDRLRSPGSRQLLLHKHLRSYGTECAIILWER